MYERPPETSAQNREWTRPSINGDKIRHSQNVRRSADSYTGALRAVLASVCEKLHVESAALLERRDGSRPEYRCLVAAGALETAAPVLAADGFLIRRLRAYPLPLPFAPNELAALAEWAAAHRPDRLDEIRALAAAGIQLAVPLRTRTEILGVLLLGERSVDSRALAHPSTLLGVTLSVSKRQARRSALSSAHTRNSCCARVPISSR